MSELSATPVSNWNAACASIISNSNITTGLVDQYGNSMSVLNNFTWGINKETCYQYCGKQTIYQVTDFDTFSNSFTNWLLPWLALTAQLPFESRNSIGNLMSLFMAIGSPALITYSLTLTILNRTWVRRKFEQLREQLEGLSNLSQDIRTQIHKRLRAAQYLLQESQQVPMRASQSDGWLSSLVALDKNEKWWSRVMKDLQNSRRGYTFSLVAQIGMALVAYTLTISTALSSSPLGGGEGQGVLLTAGGGLWIWMIPVIMGWIMCGTQAQAFSIKEAINDTTHPAFCIDEKGEIVESETQYGIRFRSGLVPRPPLLHLPSVLKSVPETAPKNGNDSIAGAETPQGLQEDLESQLSNPIPEVLDKLDTIQMPNNRSADEKKGSSGITVVTSTVPLGHFEPSRLKKLSIPSWLGFGLEGDEAREGPIFNYARLFTFREFSSTITKAFAANLESLSSDNSPGRNIVEVAESCNLVKDPLQAYTPWHKVETTVWQHMLIATGAAIFVQWGTTGPAVMIGYLTPTVGLGCRSGGYLIYGCAATFSWLLFLISSLLSHNVSLRYQKIYDDPQARFISRRDHGEEAELLTREQQSAQDFESIDISDHRRSTGLSILACLTVVTRNSGKLIAATNSFWVVISAILEYAGVYDSCWCETNSDVRGNHWVVLFATEQVFQTVSRPFWIGGVIFAYLVAVLAYLAFYLGCKRRDVDIYDDRPS